MQFSDLKPFNFVWKDSSTKSKLEIVEEQMRKALDFYELKNWKSEFDNAKKRAGCCSYMTRTISLSKHFVQLNSFEEIEGTIKHEIAHALGHIHFGASGHCKRWKRVAIAIGDDGQRCYDSKKVSMPKGKYVFACMNCSKEVTYHKKTTTIKACGDCCRKYNNGKYTSRFQLVEKGTEPKIKKFSEYRNGQFLNFELVNGQWLEAVKK